jgi:TRAP-type C4-dicarboxylate transport system permease small subunit
MRKAVERSLLRSIRKATESAIVLLFAALVIVVFFQVVARYVFNSPPAWSEELARFLQVWIILLTSPLCIRKGSHLAVDYLDGRLGQPARRLIEIAVGLLVSLYVAVVTVSGIRLLTAGRFQVSPAIGIPMSLIYVVIPLSGMLMLLESLVGTWKLIRGEGGSA